MYGMLKRCSKCLLEKSTDSFSKKRKNKDGLQGECKECRAIYLQSHYQTNKAKYIASAEQTLIHRRELLKSLKHMKPCAQCGVPYPHYVMDFDHVDRQNKSDNVSKLVSFSTKRMLAEIAKCELVCSNCHRERTYGPVAQ